MMSPIEEALREKFFPTLFRGGEINADFRKILGYSVNHGGVGMPDPGFHRRVPTTPLRRLAGNW